MTGLTFGQVRGRLDRYYYALRTEPMRAGKMPPSPYPVYNEPLSMEGNALILPDPEFPFHNADFINRVFDLCAAWEITKCVIAGDVLHFDSLSQWEANWITVKPANSLTEETESRLRDAINEVPLKYRGRLENEFSKIIEERQEPTELSASKNCLLTLEQLFTDIDYVIGNHDDRLVRALKSPLMPKSLLNLIGITDPRWRIAPYFYSWLKSGDTTFRIEHPRSASANTAVRLADKYETSVIMGHSHLQAVQYSTSGKHWAIHAGAAVDEDRLPYAAQRSTNAPAHCLGAVIVRDGYPWVLSPRSPWKTLIGLR